VDVHRLPAVSRRELVKSGFPRDGIEPARRPPREHRERDEEGSASPMQNRNRLRWREAVRDPSPEFTLSVAEGFAMLTSLRMTAIERGAGFAMLASSGMKERDGSM
jgi:hypothetical protein